jgi:hypothetical protein
MWSKIFEIGKINIFDGFCWALGAVSFFLFCGIFILVIIGLIKFWVEMDYRKNNKKFKKHDIDNYPDPR